MSVVELFVFGALICAGIACGSALHDRLGLLGAIGGFVLPWVVALLPLRWVVKRGSHPHCPKCRRYLGDTSKLLGDPWRFTFQCQCGFTYVQQYPRVMQVCEDGTTRPCMRYAGFLRGWQRDADTTTYAATL